MMLDRADAAAERDANRDGRPDLPLRAIVDLGDLGHDLVEGRIDESVELDLAHRAVTAQRHAESRSDDARFGQRGVDDAVVAEILLQRVGDPEYAAEAADVLAHQQDLRIVLQGPA